jgi:predicted nuclease of predicted toxin-antitoxin system
MKFKIDENLPTEFAEVLRDAGHDAVTVGEEGLRGASDTDLFAVCGVEDRALMTLDLDFADIRRYPPSETPGILVYRVLPQDKVRPLECLHKIIPRMEQESPAHRLWIVEQDRIRIRE